MGWSWIFLEQRICFDWWREWSLLRRRGVWVCYSETHRSEMKSLSVLRRDSGMTPCLCGGRQGRLLSWHPQELWSDTWWSRQLSKCWVTNNRTWLTDWVHIHKCWVCSWHRGRWCPDLSTVDFGAWLYKPPPHHQAKVTQGCLVVLLSHWLELQRPLPRATTCQGATVSSPFCQPSVEQWSSRGEWGKRRTPAFFLGSFWFTWPRASRWAGGAQETGWGAVFCRAPEPSPGLPSDQDPDPEVVTLSASLPLPPHSIGIACGLLDLTSTIWLPEESGDLLGWEPFSLRLTPGQCPGTVSTSWALPPLSQDRDLGGRQLCLGSGSLLSEQGITFGYLTMIWPQE